MFLYKQTCVITQITYTNDVKTIYRNAIALINMLLSTGENPLYICAWPYNFEDQMKIVYSLYIVQY